MSEDHLENDQMPESEGKESTEQDIRGETHDERKEKTSPKQQVLPRDEEVIESVSEDDEAISEIKTEGGAFINGADTKGGDVTGRDKNTTVNTVINNFADYRYFEDLSYDDLIFDIRLSGLEVKKEVIQRIEKIYVRPSKYDDQIKRIEEKACRIITIHGPEHSGKYACSLKLSTDIKRLGLIEDLKVVSYENARDIKLLTNFLLRQDFGKGTIHIFRNAFEKGISIQEISSSYLNSLSRALGKKNSYVIFTTEKKKYELLESQSLIISAFVDDKNAIFEKHLDFYHKKGSIADSVKLLAASMESVA
jgi:hypothetical protein